MNINGWERIVSPSYSYVSLTDEEYPGLTTCPMGDDSIYKHLIVTMKNYNGEPIPCIPANQFEFTITPDEDTQYPNPDNLSCTFTPLTQLTDANGEIRFTIQGDTTIIGDINITVTVDEIQLDDSDTLPCSSFDHDVSGIVDLPDLTFFSTEGWANQNPECDYNWNGVVDLVDFAMFASHYGHNH